MNTSQGQGQARAQPHPREDLHRFVNELNVRYNIGIPIPDPGLTPAMRRETEDAAGRIYRRLETHFFMGGLSTLNDLLVNFDYEAKGFWSNWVQKPGADPSTLPQTAQPPLAASLVQRDWLQTIFNRLLDEAKPNTREPRVFARTRSGPSAFAASSSRGSLAVSDGATLDPLKRRQDDLQADNPAKRRKAAAVQDSAASTSASTSASAPSRPGPRADTGRVDVSGPSSAAVAAPPALYRPGTEPASRSFASVSTAETSFHSAIFSDADQPIPTQDTVEVSMPEQYQQTQCSQQSYVDTPSSGTQAALLKLFQEYEDLASKPSGKDPSSSTIEPSDAVISSGPADGFVSATERVGAKEIVTAEEGVPVMQQRLRGVWPKCPSWLRAAPFPVVWEVTRVAQSCNVDLMTVANLQYDKEWHEQKALRRALWRHEAFQGKAFPEPSMDAAWAASIDPSTCLFDQQVVYSASLDLIRSVPNVRFSMQPLKLERSHRLARQFGADRFLELLLPSPDSSNLRAYIRDDGSFFNAVVAWLSDDHALCGRMWKAFYTKSGGSRKPQKDLQIGPDPRPVYKDRIFFFAEKSQSDNSFERVSLLMMLRWALNIRNHKNRSQPALKLFQRISLVLSRTSPTVIFEPSQMRHYLEDIVSPTGKVMNDGIARMSPAVAKAIRDRLGLLTIPCAIQGRLGSAKGMWIVSEAPGAPFSDEIWIETYPSQRKWELDWGKADPQHRTLEIRSYASMPKPASFNLQFLPVLEDRAPDKGLMREAVGSLLKDNLQRDLDGQKKALQCPLQFRQWCHENSRHKFDRIVHGHVPYQGGSPVEDEELMNSMLDAGFEPKANKFLSDIAYNLQKRKCEILTKKLNITVGRSAYLYMVVDFRGVLRENEVHIGFSTAFQADENWARTMVQGPVLVARSPAHFVSDIQKVQAVFKPELADLTDVVVFSSKGDVPLAEKLSGGDYDGDLAWVCWDTRFVDNFENAVVPQQPDLSQWMSRDKETLDEIRSKHAEAEKPLASAVAEMMRKCFEFNLSKSMLGICTNYKERSCYHKNTVCDDAATVLSTLLSNLVDQAKQGIVFTEPDFRRLQQDLRLPSYAEDPLYKRERLPDGHQYEHIIDHLKFNIARPTIDTELSTFHAALGLNKAAEEGPSHWDKDLASCYKELVDLTTPSKLVARLKDDIQAVASRWDTLMQTRDDTIGFPEKVARIYALWQEIAPQEETSGSTVSKVPHMLRLGGETSQWAILKASTAFYMYCNRSGTGLKMKPRFVWQMACRQLCYIKAEAVTSRGLSGAVGAPTAVIPSMYAGLRPDAKYVKQVTARMDGGSQFGLEGDESDELDEDD
ncbi:hypothetical protein M406DRAFT_35624 [Cryphonectria parasitica EP155]|uniref:RNA-dependent RNA polymerase n=2 Tax=Cryphonectria parasitica TaxID=5116 RepID=A0A9P4YAN1_CRYP1|nr:uncharacterized protein M406DRAFT_35624 [Cryphonectria parasitica EP155]KAF3769514.1 hypothetical protein M406DRAFT_35624 [Cryphonectria parasitica EP155]CCV01472.1 putative RNA-dependent RNA polymerase [Cryphonectria parasitica]